MSTIVPPGPQAGSLGQVLQAGNLEILPAELQVLANGRRVGLTPREFELFLVLVERRDHVVRRAELYTLVWGGELIGRNRAVDVFVRKIRRKLDACAPEWSYIHTHFGIGYRFEPEPRDP
jgi:two-component system alkaline phosphatase synthesis response regulator PhoP